MENTANFRVMLTATNDASIYFDRIKPAIEMEKSKSTKAKTLWENIARRGARLELAAGGDIAGFDPVICGQMIRDESMVE